MLSVHVHMLVYRDECTLIILIAIPIFLAQPTMITFNSFRRVVTRPVAQPLVPKLLL